MELTYDVLIVGAGHGGAQAATALRQHKFAGTIAIVGEEPHIPYERPALSKDYLAGQKDFERILIRPASFWERRQVVMLTGQHVSAVNPSAHTVTVDGDKTIGYGQLIWSAGGSARRLTCSGSDLAGVHSVRNRADVDRIVQELAAVDRVIVIGGGYIGLEAAAVLAKLGKKVMVLEALDRVLARVAGEQLSRFFEAEHRAHGVEIRLNAVVEQIEGMNGRVCGVRVTDGEIFRADMVIVGIGIVPAVEPLCAAGANCGNGVAVDGTGHTSLPDIWAVGDCALQVNPFAWNRAIRLESVQNANAMAGAVACAIVGERSPDAAVPWFWSNQYDLRLQTVGISVGHDETVTRGEMVRRSFSIIYLAQGRVISLDCVNATVDYARGKQLIASGSVVDRRVLADSAIPLGVNRELKGYHRLP